MDSDDGNGWRIAEAEYTSEVIGEGTIPELFEETTARNEPRPAQRYKGGVYDRSLAGDVVPAAPDGEYADLTYGEMRDVVRTLAAGFRNLGVGPNDRVAIFASTRMEWALTDFALLAAGAVVTTVYTESSPETVRYLLDDPDADAVVVENDRLLERVLTVEDDLDLSSIVVMDEHDADREDVYTLAEVHERGAETFDLETYRAWIDERDERDLASLIYTSGTTGEPKGVQLTHRNFRVNVNQVYRRLGPRPDRDATTPTLDSDTDTISFLPLAHVFERLAGHFVKFAAGATVGYAESPETVAEDLRALRPNTGASVPRVYERIYDGMREQASESPVKRRIFEWGIDVAREYARADEPGPLLRAKHGLADRLVYSTVRERLGGEIEFMVSGGGSLPAGLCRTFDGMGLTILEGYGLTETSPVVSTNPPEDIRPGTLGVPVYGMEVRIDESAVDASEFDASGTVGELQLTGPNVTSGYWNKKRETERAFTDDNWFRTGDVVERTDDGYLVYHDRLKEIIVLSTGKNVAPQPIEDGFATSDRVDQVMVVGDEERFVGALVVPNFEELERWATREGIDLPASREERCEDDRVRQWIDEEVRAVNETLDEVEQIKRFELVGREWTTENDLLTPSMKKKRRNIKAELRDELEAIYGERDEEPATA